MNPVEKIRGFFDSEREHINLRLEEVVDVYESHNTESIQDARDRKEGLIQKSDEVVSTLDSSLEEVRQYEDSENLDIVEDVAENFYNTRKNLIQNLELGDDLQTHSNEFGKFVEDFNDVSMKEGAVMQRIREKSGQLEKSIQNAVEHSETLDKFLEDGFKPVEKLREFREEQKRLISSKKEINNIQKDLEEDRKTSIQEEIKEKKAEINQIEQSKAMDELNQLRNKLEELEDEKNSRTSEIESSISKTERGIKKSLYAIENKDMEFRGNKSSLEDIKTRNYMENPKSADNLQKLADFIEENSILDGRQLENFKKGSKELENLEEQVDQVRELESQIENIEDEIDGFKLEDNVKSAKRELEDLEKKLGKLNEERANAEQELEEKQSQLKDEIKHLEKSLTVEINKNVSISY